MRRDPDRNLRNAANDRLRRFVDRLIVRMLLRGDERGAKLMLEEYSPELKGWLDGKYRHQMTREDREDVLQSTFVRAWRSIETFDVDRRLGPWLQTILKNTTMNHLKRNSKHRHEELHEDVTSAKPNLPSNPSNPDPNGHQSVAARKLKGIVDEDLSPKQKRVIEIELLGMTRTDADLAEEFRCTPGAIRAARYKAKRKIKEALGKLPPELGGPDHEKLNEE